VAVLDSIEDLEEDAASEGIVTQIPLLLGNLGEEVALRAELEDDVCALRRIQNLQHRDDVGVLADLVVELDLPLLEAALARLQADAVESLDGIWSTSLEVDGLVDDAISTDTENLSELNASSKNLTESILGL